MIEELIDYGELAGLMPPENVPHQDASRCFVSREEGGKIDGYIFIQLLVTVEPIWVAEEQRGTGLALKLFGEAADALLKEGNTRYFITHSDTPQVEDYLRRLGLEEIPWKTFKMQLREVKVGG